MAVRDTLQIGDPRLKAANQPITNFDDQIIKDTITDLVDTMRQNQLIGMAAQQIGENSTLFVTEPRETTTRPADQSDILRVYCNPVISWTSTEQIILYEGCGSVAQGTLFGPVLRPQIIKIEYQDQHGQPHWLKCDGILARVIQHEYDHLQGIEFTEKISDYKQLIDRDWYIKLFKDDPKLIEAAKITCKESDVLI
jgi:peptide deformylase